MPLFVKKAGEMFFFNKYFNKFVERSRLKKDPVVKSYVIDFSEFFYWKVFVILI